MLAKHQLPGKGAQGQPRQYNYNKLGNYCRDASHEGEKCLFSWHEGCAAPDYGLAIAEIEATQAMNSRTAKDKTYHLIVSFHPEDEAKLTPEACKEIESAFADALGLAGHQRCCGVHINTNNMHMHIAYNLIHPEKFTMNEPWHDFPKLAQACRAMEQKFGLVIDNGMEPSGPKKESQIVQRAGAMEAHSGELSFQSFALDKKEAILTAVAAAKDWRQAHQVFAKYGMEIKPRGNGFVIRNQSGKETIKASALDKSLSKASLVKRFGEYVKPEKQPEQSQAEEKATGSGDAKIESQAETGAETQAEAAPLSSSNNKYEKKPIQPRSPERDQLWQEFQALAAERKAAIETEKARNKAAFDELKAQWARGRAAGARLSMMLHIQKQDVAQAKAENQKRMAEIREKFPYHNWNGFLQHRAGKGDAGQAKAALSVLRSREEKTVLAATAAKAKAKIWLNVPFADKAAAKEAGARWDKGQKRWYAPGDADLSQFKDWLTSQAPAHYVTDEKLTPMARIERLQIQERQRIAAEVQRRPLFSGCKKRIDNRGVVIITLASGGSVRDSGGQIHFSKEKDAQEAARLYALAKFGKHYKLQGTTITKANGKRPNTKPHPGILRESTRNGLRTLSELPLVLDRKKQNAELFLPDHAQPDLER